MYFYHTQFKTLHNWLREGEVGQIDGVVARFGYPTILNSNPLFENGVYPLSAVLDLMGETPKAILSASKNSAHLSFSAGHYAFIEWGFNRFYRNELEIWGEKGLIVADRIFSKPPTYSPKLTLRKQDLIFERMIPPENHFVKMLSAFSRALLDPILQQQHRFRALQMADLMSIILNK
jgi:predicted dehydrogenase